MATINPPSWLQNVATHTAQGERLSLGGLIGQSGVAASGQMTVVQRGAGANMSVDVGAGTCYIKGTSNTYQGTYSCTNDAATNVVIAAADLSLARKDLIIARINDSAYAGALNSWTLEVVQGTPAASPAEPALPVSSLKLATVNVAANASSITNANIVNAGIYATSRLVSMPFVCTSTTRPTQGLVNGFTIYETDSNVLAVYIGPRSTGLVSSGIITAATGWSVGSQSGILTGRVGQLYFVMNRTGANIASSATGNIGNVSVGTVAAGWRPVITAGWANGSNGPITGGYLNSAGGLVLASLAQNVTFTTGSQITASITFVQGN
jgi:hypothetical protein